MKNLSIYVASLFLSLSTVIYAANGVLPGDGTESNPYLIEDKGDFAIFIKDSSYQTSHIILTSDIDLRGKVYRAAIMSYSFGGTFEGNNHKISNMKIVGSDMLGLFNWIYGTVMNLEVENASVAGSGYRIGVLSSGNGGRIMNCSTSGSVVLNIRKSKGEQIKNIGGLVGENKGEITGCSSTCLVEMPTSGLTNRNIGGLVGYNDGVITGSYTSGVVSGIIYVGGIAGYNYTGNITECSSSSIVSGQISIGGFVGGNVQKVYYNSVPSEDDPNIVILEAIITPSTISNCIARGQVFGQERTGGLVGMNTGDISECYSTGNVAGNFDFDDSGSVATGGLAGFSSGKINDSHATGEVIGGDRVGLLVGSTVEQIVGDTTLPENVAEAALVRKCYYAGSNKIEGSAQFPGLIGEGEADGIESCFWDKDIYVVNDPNFVAGSDGKTTAEMQTESTFIEAGWDFSDEDNDPAIWEIDGWYPELVSIKYSTQPLPNEPEYTFEIDGMNIRAGRDRESSQDSIVIKASSFNIPQAVLVDSFDFLIYSGYEDELVYSETIFFDDFTNGRCVVQNDNSRFVFNSENNTMQYVGRKIDLTGLYAPVTVVIENELFKITGLGYDNDVLSTWSNADVINGNKRMPVTLLSGVSNVIEVEKAVLNVRSREGSDTLDIRGKIGFAEGDIDLTENDILITYGEYGTTLSAEDMLLVGNRSVYKYKQPRGVNTNKISAVFDLDKCTFRIKISKASIGDQGEYPEFGLKFGELELIAD